MFTMIDLEVCVNAVRYSTQLKNGHTEFFTQLKNGHTESFPFANYFTFRRADAIALSLLVIQKKLAMHGLVSQLAFQSTLTPLSWD